MERRGEMEGGAGQTVGLHSERRGREGVGQAPVSR